MYLWVFGAVIRFVWMVLLEVSVDAYLRELVMIFSQSMYQLVSSGMLLSLLLLS